MTRGCLSVCLLALNGRKSAGGPMEPQRVSRVRERSTESRGYKYISSDSNGRSHLGLCLPVVVLHHQQYVTQHYLMGSPPSEQEPRRQTNLSPAGYYFLRASQPMQVRRYLVGPLGKRRVSSLVDIIIGRLVFRSVARERCLLFSLGGDSQPFLSCRQVYIFTKFYSL